MGTTVRARDLAAAVAAIAWLTTLAIGANAHAQSTGGSFGGGSFGGGSSSSSSSGGSSSSSGGSYYGGSSSSSSSGGSYYGGSSSSSGSYGGSSYADSSDTSSAWSDSSVHATPEQRRRSEIGLGLMVLFGVGTMVWVFRGKSRSGAPTTVINHNLVAADPNAWIGMDVAAVSVALDWRARTRVQQELATLARKGTADNLKLLSLLSRSSRLLLDERDSWIYAGVRNFTKGSTQSAEANFRATAAEFRTRFRRELVRSTDGKTSEQAAPDLTPLAREGTGVAVVTVVLAARDEIVDVLDKPDAAAVAALLLEICALPFDRFVAFEVIWSPAADADRMSSAELELFYPELVKLESPIRVGTVACAHCRARFAAELGKCPECGAPL